MRYACWFDVQKDKFSVSFSLWWYGYGRLEVILQYLAPRVSDDVTIHL